MVEEDILRHMYEEERLLDAPFSYYYEEEGCTYYIMTLYYLESEHIFVDECGKPVTDIRSKISVQRRNLFYKTKKEMLAPDKRYSDILYHLIPDQEY